MADTRKPDNAPPAPPSTEQSGPTHEEVLAAKLPPQETEQPDPILQLSVGRLGAGSITLAAIVAAFILAVVFYGLNSPGPSPAARSTPPAAPAAGGKPGPAAPSGQQTGNTGHS